MASDIDREQVKADYLSGMKQREIMEKHDIKLNTLKSWIKRYGWNSVKKGAPQKKKKGAPLNNINAAGNVGGKAPDKNTNAVKHGIFQKYLPEESMDIIESMTNDPLDVLWGQIQIAYAAIVRAQKIMYVKDIEDSTTTRIEEKRGKISGERWEVQQAWDKQANFLKAQARAQGELRAMIKQYDELLNKNNELATEEQKSRIALLKARTQVANRDIENGDIDNSENIQSFLKALRPTEEELQDLFNDDEGEEVSGEETEETE